MINNTLIVVAHHNGSHFLAPLLASLDPEYRVLVVDTKSTADELYAMQGIVNQRPKSDWDWIQGGYCVGAYQHAVHLAKLFPNLFREPDSFLFLHDSMRAKVPDVVSHFQGKGDVVAWIGFPMDYDAEQAAFLRRYYGDLSDAPPTAIFGPIFYATREAMDALAEKSVVPPVTNRTELCAMERGYAFAFHRAGIPITYLEEYDNDRLDVRRDYRLFDKWRPNRN